MDEDGAMQFLASHGHQKTGNDVIFSWLARYQHAAAAGAAAVNGTVGALLNDDGTLAINTVVDEAIRQAPATEFAAYAPLKGLPSFLDLAATLALGEHRSTLDSLGVHTGATATPGAPARFSLQHQTSPNEAKASFCETGTGVLTRAFCEVVALTLPLIPCFPPKKTQARHCSTSGPLNSAWKNWFLSNPP